MKIPHNTDSDADECGGCERTEVLLRELNKRQIRLVLVGGRLRCYGPTGAMTAEIRMRIQSNKLELIRFVSDSERMLDTLPTISRVVGCKDLSILANQKMLLEMTLHCDRRGFFPTGMVELVRGEFEVSAFCRAFRRLVERHDVLQMRLVGENIETAEFVVDREAPLALPSLKILNFPRYSGPDFREVDDTSLRHQVLSEPIVESWVSEVRTFSDLDPSATIFDAGYPLFRLGIARISKYVHVTAFFVDHLIVDGQSWKIVREDLTELYRSEVESSPAELQPIPVGFSDYMHWRNKNCGPNSRRADIDSKFWRQLFAGITNPSLLSRDTSIESTDDSGERISFSLPPLLVDELSSLSASSGISVFSFLFSGVCHLLSQRLRERAVCLQTVLEGRDREETEIIVGHFATLVPVVIEIDSEWSFIELARQVAATVSKIRLHSSSNFIDYIPLGVAKEYSEEECDQFSVTLEENAKPFGETRNKTECHREYFDSDVFPVIRFLFFSSPSQLLCSVIYNRRKQRRETMDSWIDDFLNIISEKVFSPKEKLGDRRS